MTLKVEEQFQIYQSLKWMEISQNVQYYKYLNKQLKIFYEWLIDWLIDWF